MRPRLAIVLAAAAVCAAGRAPASGATLAVTITGVSDTGYEINVSGVLKNGRLGAVDEGPATVRDLVDVGGRDSVKAVVTFHGPGGVTAVCPAVEIKLDHAQFSCEPSFVLTDRHDGSRTLSCEARCEPRKKSHSDEDDDDDDWVYALNSPATPASQSFYTGAISSLRTGRVYSAPASEELVTR